MSRSERLSYVPAMFAACMLFQTMYVLCVVLWWIAPDLAGHAILGTLFPRFKFLGVVSFIYGLVLSMIYGWFVAATFVFFHNLWPRVASALVGRQ